MPKLSRKTSHVEERQPFGVYDGPEVPRGNYPGVIRSVVLRDTKDKTGQYLNVLVELQSPEDSAKAVYNGAPIWTMIYLGDQEANIQREQAFYKAVCGQMDVDIVTDDSKPSPNVTKIGGKVPVGVAVRVDVRREEYNGNWSSRGDSIWPGTAEEKFAARSQQAKGADPDADLKPSTRKPRKSAQSAPESTEETSVEAERHLSAVPDPSDAGTVADYGSMNLPSLRKAAKEAGIDTAGKSKADLIQALEDASGGAPEESEFSTIYAEDIANLPQEQLDKLISEANYDLADFDGMNRDEIKEILLEDGVIEKRPF